MQIEENNVHESATPSKAESYPEPATETAAYASTEKAEMTGKEREMPGSKCGMLSQRTCEAQLNF